MPAVKKKLLDGIDQYSAYYSVICVFGSVVGCVVVPLITQSIESIIFSAILISLTAKTLHSRSIAPREEVQDERRRGRESSHEKKPKRKKVQQVQRVVDVEAVRRQREVDLLKLEEQRKIERELKLEEKRLKKAHKREERLKRKEEEEKERLKEEQQRREREERRSQEKKEKEEFKKSLLGFRTLDSIESLTRQRPARRERKNSSSSSGSSRSTTGTQPHRRQKNHSRYSRTSSDSNLSPPLSLSPSPIPHHPPMSQMSPAWQPGSVQCVQQKHSLSELEGTRIQKVSHRKRASSTSSSAATTTCSQGTNNLSPSQGHVYAVNPLAPCSSFTPAPERKLGYWPLEQGLMPLQCCENLNQQENASLWISGPHSAPEYLTVCPPTSSGDRSVSTPIQDQGPSFGFGSCPVVNTASDGSCYSLFSGSGQSLFGSSLIPVGVDGRRGGAGGGTVTSMADQNVGTSVGESPKFDEWPVL